MAISYYDDAIIEKIKKWVPDNNKLRVLDADDTKRLFELKADDTNDAPVQLPFVTLSRNKDLEILSSIKQLRSFNSRKLISPNERQLAVPEKTVVFNAIPVKTTYQLNIYTKTKYEGEEYLRNFLFKIINNPTIVVDIPYNNIGISHTANLRVLDTVSDTSDIAQRIFPGQFYRWTIQLELQDGFLFNLPYKTNSYISSADIDLSGNLNETNIIDNDEIEVIEFTNYKQADKN